MLKQNVPGLEECCLGTWVQLTYDYPVRNIDGPTWISNELVTVDGPVRISNRAGLTAKSWSAMNRSGSSRRKKKLVQTSQLTPHRIFSSAKAFRSSARHTCTWRQCYKGHKIDQRSRREADSLSGKVLRLDNNKIRTKTTLNIVAMYKSDEQWSEKLCWRKDSVSCLKF